ncbi:MAG: DUF4249 domain-containing protein [Imperialibacter sp.]|uniref:DUF4249 domain-containing protein n=1 Tax=Imperialibacter sp. TaxID=2038411 RepID=UPI0032EFB93A
MSMRIKTILNYWLATVLALGTLGVSCIEKIEPSPSFNNRSLVVDGLITDEWAPYTIKLSRTASLGTQITDPEPGATVVVKSSEGQEYSFEESSPGLYQSNPDEFIGKTGRFYTLEITTKNGQHYLSDATLLKAVPPIDSVYFEPALRLADFSGDTITGVAILVDTHDTTNTTSYYRWDWEEAWEIKVPYPNTYDWVVWPVLIPTAERFGYEVPNNHRVERCYSTKSSSGLLLSTSVGLAQDRISKYEVTYVSTEGYKLNSLYSIQVRQYALDEKEHHYWSELKKLSESLGTLFDPQPYDLRGNMHSINDPAEPVLGYFSASAVSKKRLYIDRSELLDIKFPYSVCAQELAYVENKYVQNYIEAGYLIAALGDYGSGHYYLAPAECCDCRFHGVLEKPDFWPL